MKNLKNFELFQEFLEENLENSEKFEGIFDVFDANFAFCSPQILASFADNPDLKTKHEVISETLAHEEVKNFFRRVSKDLKRGFQRRPKVFLRGPRGFEGFQKI